MGEIFPIHWISPYTGSSGCDPLSVHVMLSGRYSLNSCSIVSFLGESDAWDKASSVLEEGVKPSSGLFTLWAMETGPTPVTNSWRVGSSLSHERHCYICPYTVVGSPHMSCLFSNRNSFCNAHCHYTSKWAFCNTRSLSVPHSVPHLVTRSLGWSVMNVRSSSPVTHS